ncbi:MAG: hypothetical protein E7246_08075 [Lachnoclostridium sp.]|nr:hypothetical protein [Lachnoclostridium sp.]
MKMKICPCCDQPINGFYCKGCRKIVWKPVEQNVQYYLNTRHPEYEHACAYHDGVSRQSTERMTASETEAKKAEIKARMLQRKQEPKSAKAAPVQTVKRSSQAARRHSSLIAIITAMIVMITVFITFTMIIVFNTMDDVTHMGWAEAVPEPMAVAPARETPLDEAPAPEAEYFLELPVPAETDLAYMEDWELTDDEVRELGVACNGFGHFPIIFEDAVAVLRDCISDAGYGWSMSVYSYNQFIDEYNWYETVYEFTIRNEEEYAGFLNINVDTATGEIHGMEMYTHYEKGFSEVADIAVKFLERIGAAENLPDGTEFFETAYKSQGDDGFCIQSGLEVVCEIPELDEGYDFYRMEIYAPGYYTIAE